MGHHFERNGQGVDLLTDRRSDTDTHNRVHVTKMRLSKSLRLWVRRSLSANSHRKTIKLALLPLPTRTRLMLLCKGQVLSEFANNGQTDRTCGVVPVAIIGADVVVEKHRFEPFSPESPVKAQVFDQKGSHILASSIRHPSRLLEEDRRKSIIDPNE